MASWLGAILCVVFVTGVGSILAARLENRYGPGKSSVFIVYCCSYFLALLLFILIVWLARVGGLL